MVWRPGPDSATKIPGAEGSIFVIRQTATL
ncbi:hypothetical protein JMJ77_0009117 [Colletotrichum scovillei]|uniref:Uncharacterized protein n=1 Tax=Colletotrichum scovillei TaxID=1209932 RepID=A0A9P7U947_9PEZI|nr:hypothetical protein JMJ77_0009117 [Colletotrichum scovillei]KAG7052192.1 hypothetical protein JMJ78_0005214 [Colletotrichum scovillei]KAG7064481.1 hypothetical protein JMJ76_0012246 [Colletotrichum scovillei]